jgi:hypothetical protein
MENTGSLTPHGWRLCGKTIRPMNNKKVFQISSKDQTIFELITLLNKQQRLIQKLQSEKTKKKGFLNLLKKMFLETY